MSYYRALYEIAKEVNSALAVEEVLNAVVKSTTEAMGAKGCSLMLLTPDRKRLVHHITHGLSEWYIRKGPVRADAIINEVLQGSPVVILDVENDPRVQYPEQARSEGITSMVSVPVLLRDEVIGLLRLYATERREFSPQDLDFLCAAANLGAIALEKATFHESLEKELQRVTSERAKLEEDKERFVHFLTTTAHDLKAPLSAIQSYLGVLLGGFVGELNQRQRKMMERSSQRVMELLNLISDLLDIPRIEIGQIVDEVKEISLPPVVESALEGVRPLAEQKGIGLTLEMPPSLPPIHASDVRLKQVLSNLLANAIDYTSEGSVTLRLMEMDDDIHFEVIDTGIGIPPQDLPLVFDDFFRASNVKTGGTGLGLSIARRIVEAHGGRIWVESPCPETGKGSKFTFTIPKGTKVEKR